MKNEPIRVAYPMLGAFGTRHEFLDVEAAKNSTTEERIRSVWPFVLQRVLAFQKTLRPRERANYDAEDVTAELFVALASRDAGWIPEKGKYITYAARVIDNELCAIRDNARTVHSPRNTACRLKEYAAEEEAGTITPERAKTAAAIRRTSTPTTPVDDAAHSLDARDGDPLSILIAREEAERQEGLLRAALDRLPAEEAEVVIRLHGLFGHEVETAKHVAQSTGRTAHEVRRLKTLALARLSGDAA